MVEMHEVEALDLENTEERHLFDKESFKHLLTANLPTSSYAFLVIDL